MPNPIDALVRDYVHRRFSDDLATKRLLLATAEEWFDGEDSVMRQFCKNDGILPAEDYAILGDEAAASVREVSRELMTKWRPRLNALVDFACEVDAFSNAASKLFETAKSLADKGAYESEATSLVIDAFAKARGAPA